MTRFAAILIGTFVFLVAALFLITRLYIHSFQVWRRKAQADALSMQAEIETLKRRVNQLTLAEGHVEAPEVLEPGSPVRDMAG